MKEVIETAVIQNCTATQTATSAISVPQRKSYSVLWLTPGSVLVICTVNYRSSAFQLIHGRQIGTNLRENGSTQVSVNIIVAYIVKFINSTGEC